MQATKKRVIPEVVRSPRNCELATFCFRCGGPVSTKQFCRACGISWERLYTVRCPSSTDGNTWCHIYPPTSATMSHTGDRVVMAHGFAMCEGCDWRPHIYRWQPDGLKLIDDHGRWLTIPLGEVESS